MTEKEQTLFYQNLGELIKSARKKAGHKQEPFAKLLGISRVSVVNIEKGRQHPPIHLLWRMAQILKVDTHALIPKVQAPQEVPSDWKQLISKELKGKKAAQVKMNQFFEVINLDKK